METNKEVVEAQGVKTKKEQKVSATFTLKAMGEHLEKLKGLGLVEPKGYDQVRAVLEAAGAKFVAQMWKK